MDVSTCEHPSPSHENLFSSDLGLQERSQLCLSCSSLDFKGVFALSSAQVGRYGIALTDTRTDIHTGCILCSLVASLMSLNINPTSRSFDVSEAGYHLRALDSLWPLRLRRTNARVAANPSIVIAVVQGRSSRTLKRNRLNEAISRGLIVSVPQDSCLKSLAICPFVYTARTISCTQPDFARIGSWLRECHESESGFHYRCKSQPRRTAFLSRVIDCETREIVPLTPDLEYLALSYVWGNKTSNTEIDQTVQFNYRLPNLAPQTVEDAISVVRSLQKRYLWVDRYCIWQSENKHLQIQNMDQIYQNALTTIVAVDGDSAESGLRGVSSPRHIQTRFRTDAGILAYTFPHVSYPLSMSTWVTRGWTYQEAILSRSCLFFTRYQVYFACKTHLRSEAVEQKSITHRDRIREVLAPRLMSVTQQVNFAMSNHLQPFFYGHIKEYTSRSLSWDSDALKAFKGIIASGDEYTYWGIPFTNAYPRQQISVITSECAFSQSLAWIGRRLPLGGGAIRRRKDFPTWSWISLADQIETQDKDYNIHASVYKCSAFYVADETKKWLRITDVFRNAQERRTLIIPEHGRELLVDAWATQVCLRSTETEGIYSIHLPEILTHDQTLPYSRSMVSGQGLVDCTDAELLSKIESQTWIAIKLFWWERSTETEYDDNSHWMLVDRYNPVARRIGLIRPESRESKGNLKIGNLTGERRRIRIE